jgi:ABC-type nitrate/sulfonate/bicarbonate transport system permease component
MGATIGLLVSFWMVSSRPAAAIAQPYLIGLRVAQLIAIDPLLFLWLGDGVLPRAILVATLTVFPVAIGSYDGLRAVPRQYLDLGRAVDAPTWKLFVHVRIPAAAPSIFAGLKLAAALSIVGTVVAEFVTLRSGLGYQVFYASTALDTARMFAALLVLALLGVTFYFVPVVVERRARWGQSTT